MTKSTIARVCGLVLGIFVAGCGSSSGGSSDPAAAFAGAWLFSAGSIAPTCSGGLNISPFGLTGDTLQINKVSSTEVSTSLNGNGFMCDVNFTVSGSTATATAGQTCAFNLSVGGTTQAVTVDITSWTLTVSGNTLSMNMAGSATVLVVSCTATGSGTATRSSDGGAGG